jgi:hypothetical protein
MNQNPEKKLERIIQRLAAHRAAMRRSRIITPADTAKERRLLRAYHREVESGC